MNSSAFRREVMPAWAITFCNLSITIILLYSFHQRIDLVTRLLQVKFPFLVYQAVLLMISNQNNLRSSQLFHIISADLALLLYLFLQSVYGQLDAVPLLKPELLESARFQL